MYLCRKLIDMVLRIKEVCKAKGLTMTKLAEMLSISPVSLSSAVNGNPTVTWLQKVADVLEVEVADLIEREKPTVVGCVRIGDEMYPIGSREDLIKVLSRLDTE